MFLVQAHLFRLMLIYRDFVCISWFFFLFTRTPFLIFTRLYFLIYTFHTCISRNIPATVPHVNQVKYNPLIYLSEHSSIHHTPPSVDTYFMYLYLYICHSHLPYWTYISLYLMVYTPSHLHAHTPVSLDVYLTPENCHIFAGVHG